MNQETPFPQDVLAQIGKKILYRPNFVKPKKEVVIMGVRWSKAVIKNLRTGEIRPSIEYLMSPTDGKRNFWSIAFPINK